LSLTLLFVACGDGEPAAARRCRIDGGCQQAARSLMAVVRPRLTSDGSYYQGEFKDGQSTAKVAHHRDLQKAGSGLPTVRPAAKANQQHDLEYRGEFSKGLRVWANCIE
jgi:hypothetical protein